LIEQAHLILKSFQEFIEDDKPFQEKYFNELKSKVYYWQNNPENNEKYLRKELNAPIKEMNQDNRFNLLYHMTWISQINTRSGNWKWMDRKIQHRKANANLTNFVQLIHFLRRHNVRNFKEKNTRKGNMFASYYIIRLFTYQFPNLRLPRKLD